MSSISTIAWITFGFLALYFIVLLSLYFSNSLMFKPYNHPYSDTTKTFNRPFGQYVIPMDWNCSDGTTSPDQLNANCHPKCRQSNSDGVCLDNQGNPVTSP